MRYLRFLGVLLILISGQAGFAAERNPEWATRQNDLLVVGQSIYDMVFRFDDASKLQKYLEKFELEIGDGKLIDSATADMISKELKVFYSGAGGSASNTAVGLVNLGQKATLASVLVRDRIGHLYENELKNFGVNTEFFIPTELSAGDATGVVLVILAPDGERTMLAYPGVSKKLLDKVQIDEKSLNSYKVIMSEGYIWDHPGNPELITEMFRRAKKQGVHTAFTFGDKYIVEKYREEFIKLASELDILFLNEREALALIETDDIQEAVEALQKMCSLAIVTVGEKGAMIVTPENINYIKAVQVKNIVDRTGAGDQFAAGFLYGYMNNLEHVKSGEIGAKNASYILTQMGAKPKNKLAQSLEGKL